MPISEQTYELVALEDGDEVWELACGRLRKKPGTTARHGEIGRQLHALILLQIDRRQFSVGDNMRVRVSTGSFFVPDLGVVPRSMIRRHISERPTRLEVYEEPLPLIVEVWSPRTGDYDVEEKLREYQRRGDAEIWRIHPIERTLTAWRRQADGSYAETLYREGRVSAASLPGVIIDLAELFE